jgi:hypothetical protein
MSRKEFLRQSSKYVAAGAVLASAPDLMAALSKKQKLTYALVRKFFVAFMPPR